MDSLICYWTVDQLHIAYKYINIKQHLQVTYTGCVLDKTISGKPITLNRLLTKWEIKISL